MSSLRPQDRKSLCRFTFADGRQCRTPRSPNHPRFCCDKLARDLSYFFSGQYLSACDLSAALGRLIAGVARGDIKPRSARTLAYLAQTLVQTIHLAEDEYIEALGTDSWRRAIRNTVRQNFDYRNPSPQPKAPPDQAPHVVAGLQTGGGQAPQPASTPQPAPSPHTPMPRTSTEFVQQVLARLSHSVSPAPDREYSRGIIPPATHLESTLIESPQVLILNHLHRL